MDIKPHFILFLSILLFPCFLKAQQIGFDEINDADVSLWIESDPKIYQGIYHFGESELESDLHLLVDGNMICAQIQSGRFSNDGMAWIREYQNLKNVRIEGSRFYSDETDGEFVRYYNGKDSLQGLKVWRPWSASVNDGYYEIGLESGSFERHVDGRFPQASIRLLAQKDLSSLSAMELKIMRNEIFARYGYRFRAGGEMETYFKQQKWYDAQYDDVNDFLTGIEKANIQLIREMEK